MAFGYAKVVSEVHMLYMLAIGIFFDNSIRHCTEDVIGKLSSCTMHTSDKGGTAWLQYLEKMVLSMPSHH